MQLILSLNSLTAWIGILAIVWWRLYCKQLECYCCAAELQGYMMWNTQVFMWISHWIWIRFRPTNFKEWEENVCITSYLFLKFQIRWVQSSLLTKKKCIIILWTRDYYDSTRPGVRLNLRRKRIFHIICWSSQIFRAESLWWVTSVFV